MEKEGGPVTHPDPGMADVGLQGGNPVADHVQILELVHDRIVEQGTGIVDPEIPVDCSRLWVLVTWNADNPGVGPGSLLFLELKVGPARWLKSLSLWLVIRSLIRLKTLALLLETWSRGLLARTRWLK